MEYDIDEKENNNLNKENQEIEALYEIRENLLSKIKDYQESYGVVKGVLNSVLNRLEELNEIEFENKSLRDRLKSVNEDNGKLQQQNSRLKEKNRILEQKNTKLQDRLENLRKSKLGRITVGYWEFKKKFGKG